MMFRTPLQPQTPKHLYTVLLNMSTHRSSESWALEDVSVSNPVERPFHVEAALEDLVRNTSSKSLKSGTPLVVVMRAVFRCGQHWVPPALHVVGREFKRQVRLH
jgi:hypothetical protein